MLVMMIIGWLVTVGCFLLYVRRLRGKYTHDNSPIANSEHQPDDAWLASSYAGNQQSIEPERLFEFKTSLTKIPKGWKKADGKTRHVKTGLVDIMWGDGAIDLKQLAKRYHDAWIKSDFKTLDIIAYRKCKPKKVFSSKSKTGKQRKTVTVKKRATK
jgi:hypothetical protein